MGYGRPADQDYWGHLAQDAHDPPFRAALMNQLLPTFRRLPGSDDDRRTITFMLGVIAHNEADNPWHFNSNNRVSFLEAAMSNDANDHTTVELGTDVFANVEYGQGGTEDSWWTPLPVVRAAYLAIGHDVVESQVADGQYSVEFFVDDLFAVLDHFGLEPHEALFVGDGEVDMLAARDAGVPFIAYKSDLPALARIRQHTEIFRHLG